VRELELPVTPGQFGYAGLGWPRKISHSVNVHHRPNQPL
jgi:hypothetical protein